MNVDSICRVVGTYLPTDMYALRYKTFRNYTCAHCQVVRTEVFDDIHGFESDSILRQILTLSSSFGRKKFHRRLSTFVLFD